jgi:alginate O-acetyltransferase complex protein AlgJ
LSAVTVCADGTVTEVPSPEVKAFLDSLGAIAANAAKTDVSCVPGKEWWFFVPELRHLSVGPFWGEAAASVSKAGAKGADPLPAILSFHEQLKERGIRLIVVPVPAKAAVWPDMLSSGTEVKVGEAVPRVDVHDAAFYALLKAKGVDVLDLAPIFAKQRMTEHGPVYCQTDTHWSGTGLVVASRAISERIKAMEWYEAPAAKPYKIEWDEAVINGDLMAMLPVDALKPQREAVKLRFVSRSGEGAPEPDESSPVLLMGDSHTLVFHAGGDLHAKGAGLPDQLAYELGMPVDLMGTRGSGSTTVRVDLYRRCQRNADYLARKKVVVWCFTARDFTESSQGWRVLPVSP